MDRTENINTIVDPMAHDIQLEILEIHNIEDNLAVFHQKFIDNNL
jgi:hypothetical protein